MHILEEFGGDIIQWLRGFYYVAHCRNYSSAAKRMNINRSAIRYHVHKLEEMLGVRLFDRVDDVMQLTQEGLCLLNWAETVFDTVSNMLTDVPQSAHLQGKIKLFTQQYLCAFALQDVIRDFLAQYENVSIEINTGTLGTGLDKLDSRESEFAVTVSPEHNDLYSFTPLFKEQHYLVAKKGCFSLTPELLKEDLEKVPFIVMNSGSAKPTTEEVFAELRINPRKIISVDSDLLALEYVKAGMGVAFLRKSHLCNCGDILEGYCADSFFPEAEIGILSLKNAYISPVARLFINFCLDYFQDGRFCNG